MDTFAALALATEPPPTDILDREPVDKDEPVVNQEMNRNVQGHALYQLIILLIILFAGPYFLVDFSYENQCAEYDDSGKCNKEKLNPYYTETEYYEPSLWEPLLENDRTNRMNRNKKLKDGYAFDKKLLYSWKCNMFTQENFHYKYRISTINMCFLEDPEQQLKDGSSWMSELRESDRKIVNEFKESKWQLVDPTTIGIRVPQTNDEPEKIYTSKGMRTEQVKLFTYIFNTFVFMQVFNQINARKLQDGQFNVFDGIQHSKPFIAVTVIIFGIQLLMIEFGGRTLKCWPLNFYQSLVCIAFGMGELIWGVLVKLVPTKFFLKLTFEDSDDSEGESKSLMASLLKKKSSNYDQ